jgi:lipoprotein NlpD
MLIVLGLQACAPTVKRIAPVEDRAGTARPVSSASTGHGGPVGAEAGSYVVQRGDTLAKIALDHGVSWRDLARWNQIDNPNVIEVGQVLRINGPAEPMTSRPLTARPLPPQTASNARVATAPAQATPAAPSAAPPAAPAQVNPPSAPVATEDAPAFLWPAQGNVAAGFDESRNKGLDIIGKAGDPVLAAADGRVVYAGSGLRGYGNLIIVKHNNTYLTAYAHNQTLLVKEDQDVQRGQKIAEMGNSDADQVKLHFEIRRQGKPVDPARLLPAR